MKGNIILNIQGENIALCSLNHYIADVNTDVSNAYNHTNTSGPINT